MIEAFKLVHESTSKHHMHQKILYDEKIHEKPYKDGVEVAGSYISHGKDHTALLRK